MTKILKYKDITGQKFGRLTALYPLLENRNTKEQLKWLCSCECGKEHIVRSAHLISNRIVSCGCYNQECRLSQFSDNTPFVQLFGYYKRNAKKRKISFCLSFEEFVYLIKQKCEYCTEEPSAAYTKHYTSNVNGRKHKTILYNGIDRVDNEKGYDINNVVSCCKYCNSMKHTYDLSNFLAWVNKVSINLISEQKTKRLIDEKLLDKLQDNQESFVKNKRAEFCSLFAGLNSLFTCYKKEAYTRDLCFNIDIFKFFETTQQDCFYCGEQPIKSFIRYKTKTRQELLFNGVDRVNNDIGYIEENIVACCSRCNKAKLTQTYDEFYKRIIMIHNNRGLV